MTEDSEDILSQWKSSSGELLGFHEAGRLGGHQGRYSYVKRKPGDLSLKIDRVTLEDDGFFECQMISTSYGPRRAEVYLDVIVPPQKVDIIDHKTGSTIDVIENDILNLTCMIGNTKPEVDISWFLNGKMIEDEVNRKNNYNLNKTVTNYANIIWRPRKSDHGKSLTCQGYQQASSTSLQANLTLNILYTSDKPVLTIVEDETHIRQGDNVTLVCNVQGGNPPPSVIWYAREKPIGQKYTYNPVTKETINTHVVTVDYTDNTVPYECRAVNKGLSKVLSNELILDVAYPPKTVVIEGESTVIYGETTTLECSSSESNPPSKILWNVNGQSMVTDSYTHVKTKIGVITKSNLTIHSSEVVNRRHLITVECTAQNSEGSTSAQHVVKLLEPPHMPVISDLDDSAHMEGDVVNVTCEVSGGYPLAEISWYRGQAKISGARVSTTETSVISIISIPLERSMNNQLLTCEAKNAALREPLRVNRSLNVLFPPRRVSVRHESQYTQLIAGKEARLVCSASYSNPPADIKWHFYPNGERQPFIVAGETTVNETSHDAGFTVESTVTFIPNEKHDETVARCFATSPVWTYGKNASIPLTVFYSPQSLGDSIINVVVQEGDFFRKNFSMRGNPPISAWRWGKNNIPFDHTVGNVFARGATLTGRMVKKSDSGIYTVTAINSIGTINVTINLTVEFSAKIVSISSPIIATLGEMALLECEAEAEPMNKKLLTWMRNDQEMNASYVGYSRAFLRLNITDETVGEYSCVANNGIGLPDVKYTYLLIKTPPRILKIPSLSRAAGPLGGRARARCRVNTVPDAEFVWYRGGDVIKSNNSKYNIHSTQQNYSVFESVLYINALSPEDYASNVRCVAKNSLGSDSFSIAVVAPSPPHAPTDIELTKASSDSLQFMWEPGFDGGYNQMFEVRYQKEGEEIVHGINTTQSAITLTGLKYGTTYNIKLRAINERGFSSKFTAPVFTATTLSENGTTVTDAKKSFQFKDLFVLQKLHYIIFGTILLFCNCIVCCFIHRRHKQNQLREKTSFIRTANNGERMRPVQMYGTMMQSTAYGHEDVHDLSEDDHSIKTMIETSSRNNNPPYTAYTERGNYRETSLYDPYYDLLMRNALNV
ncbi:unnamed protein product [Auanema sp. JU1783]|nr:unnamed protein product [Auanema sp. JU1783]